MSKLEKLIAQAVRIAVNAADLEQVDGDARGTHDDVHHIGDDTGRVVTEAYRTAGAAGAADVINAYLTEFNRRRERDGIRSVTGQEAIKHLAWAIPPGGINGAQQTEVCQAFERRWGGADR